MLSIQVAKSRDEKERISALKELMAYWAAAMGQAYETITVMIKRLPGTMKSQGS